MNRLLRFGGPLALTIMLMWAAGSAHGATAWALKPDRVTLDRLDRAAYWAADMLEENLLYALGRTRPVLAASFVNMDRLEQSSTFGRLLADRIATRFSQHGYHVIELKLRKTALAVQPGNGELALSRDLQLIQSEHDAQAVMVGTYILAGKRLHATVKLVGTADQAVLSSCDFSMDLTPELLALAQKESLPPPKARPRVKKAQGPLASGMVHIDPADGKQARTIQARLAELGHYTARIDGQWGRKSREALKNFKRKVGLAPLYQWDLDTQKALFRNSGH